MGVQRCTGGSGRIGREVSTSPAFWYGLGPACGSTKILGLLCRASSRLHIRRHAFYTISYGQLSYQNRGSHLRAVQQHA